MFMNMEAAALVLTDIIGPCFSLDFQEGQKKDEVLLYTHIFSIFRKA